jgi:hypothetical protein
VTTAIDSRSALHPHWFGDLALDNYEDVASHLRAMLEGKRYAFASSHDGHPGLSELRVSQRLEEPIRVTLKDGMASIVMVDGRYVWGLHTTFATEREAAKHRHEGGKGSTFVSYRTDYRGEQLTIKTFNGYGELLTWIVAPEVTP